MSRYCLRVQRRYARAVAEYASFVSGTPQPFRTRDQTGLPMVVFLPLFKIKSLVRKVSGVSSRKLIYTSVYSCSLVGRAACGVCA